MQKRWILSEPKPELVHSLCHSHSISMPVAQILVNRSITEANQVQHFLNPSLAHLPEPETLLDMEKAVRRLLEAIRAGESITVYGDYDVDGTTATALLVNFFSSVGARVDFYIPHRLKEGYSLNAGALRKLKERGTKVIITVDNGISAVAEAEVAKELGLDLIITDHHEVSGQMPNAFAVINPKRKGDPFPGKELAGVGVAFYLLIALRKALREAGLLRDVEPNLRRSLDLVAVGTVADMAPLTGINRVLVREGLKVLTRSPRPGLQALMDVAGVGGEIRAEQIAFRLGPRINAVGRLEDASLGVRLLLSEDPAAAKELASRLNAANEERQRIEDDIVCEAVARVEAEGLHRLRRSLIVSDESWHPGVVGIVASRLVEKYHLPTLVLTKDGEGLKGSARSIRNFNLIEALQACSEFLIKFGGHRYAAGLSLKRERLSELVERFDQIVRNRLSEEDFTPSIKLDVESELERLDAKLIEQLQYLEPFGLGNPEPLLLLRRVRVCESRIVGEKHLRLKVASDRRQMNAIGFRLAEKILAPNSLVDLAFSPGWNEWNGSKSIQLRLIDLRPS